MSDPQNVAGDMKRRFTVAMLMALSLAALPAFAERIVAVGDVHGSLEEFEGILRRAELIDEENRWIAGSATFVQTGDLTDRGPQVRGVLDLMMSLEEQAAAAGGRVVALLGNHEVNNLVSYFGSQPNLSPDFAAIVGFFADGDSEARSRKAYSAWKPWQRRYPQCAAPSSRREWMDAHPPGYVEYVEALAPEGIYGRWLRQRDAVARIGDTIFLHGGLSPDPPAEFPTADLRALNDQIALELRRFDADRSELVDKGIVLPFSTLSEMFCAVRGELAAAAIGANPDAGATAGGRLQEIYDRLPLPQTWLAFHGEGPLWFRGFANWTDDEGPDAIARVADAYGAARFVVGHTPRTGSIQVRFDNRVFLIDTGMVFTGPAGGRASALELRDGEATAIYPEATASVLSPPTEAATAAPTVGPKERTWLDPEGEPLPFAGAGDVTDFLQTATVESVEDIPVGVAQPKRLLLVQGSVRSKAVFRHVNVTEQRRRLSTGQFVMFFRDHYINEVAAYELSLLLGLDTVPPTVKREIDGQPGSVQMWIEDAMMETQRREDDIEPPNRTRFTRQFYDMRIFDNLINNTDRNSGNILLDPDWKMWWIDHTRSFARSKELPAPQDVIGCSRSLFDAIKALDDDVVEARLEGYLGTPEIRSLQDRRRRLVALIEKRIAENGEDNVLFAYGEPDKGVTISYEDGAV